MLAGLWARLRQVVAAVRAAAGDDVHERLADFREQTRFETVALNEDAADLAQRIRRNARAGRGALGGQRTPPL
jgi:hypothetical protein